MTLVEEIKSDIIERLNERIGQDYYLSELGNRLTESENCNGSWYCSTFKAKEAIKNNFDEISNFVEWYEENYGEKPMHDPFKDPELFHCLFMIFAYENVFNKAVSKRNDWDKNVEVTKRLINSIKKQLETINEIL